MNWEFSNFLEEMFKGFLKTVLRIMCYIPTLILEFIIFMLIHVVGIMYNVVGKICIFIQFFLTPSIYENIKYSKNFKNVLIEHKQ